MLQGPLYIFKESEGMSGDCQAAIASNQPEAQVCRYGRRTVFSTDQARLQHMDFKRRGDVSLKPLALIMVCYLGDIVKKMKLLSAGF